MTAPGMTAAGRSARMTFAGVMALLAIQWLWHAALFPSGHPRGYWIAGVLSFPLALLAIALWLGRPSARYWSGVIALLYFCHGVTEAWTLPAERGIALVESGLAVAVILAANWNGLASRFKRRPAPPPNV